MFTWFLLGRRAAASLPPQVHSHHLITRLDFQKLQPWPRFTCALMTTLCVCTSLLYFLVCLWRVKIVEWCWLIKKKQKKNCCEAARGGGPIIMLQKGEVFDSWANAVIKTQTPTLLKCRVRWETDTTRWGRRLAKHCRALPQFALCILPSGTANEWDKEEEKKKGFRLLMVLPQLHN